MSADPHGPRVPRAALFAAALLLCGSIALAAGSRALREPPPPARVVASANLRFEDRASGSIVITDADDGRVIGVVQPETNGFLRGVLRGMFRARKLDHTSGEAAQGRQAPFRLEQDSTGQLSLLDPSTSRRVDLGAFGTTNSLVFANLLTVATSDASSP